MPKRVVTSCIARLRDDPVLSDGDAFVGVMDFEMSFASNGRAIDLCLVGSNYGDQLDYTRCVMNKIREFARGEPGTRIPYRLTYCIEASP